MFLDNLFQLARIAAFPLLLASSVATPTGSSREINDSAKAAWTELSPNDQGIALQGYADCARALPHSVVLAWNWQKQRARVNARLPLAVDLPTLLFSMRHDVTSGPPEKHAEHDPGRFGFHDGTWWSELGGTERLAYLRGIAWCSTSYKTDGADVFTTGDSRRVIATLDKWFGVRQDGAVDITAPHAKIPVFLALRKTGLLKAR